MRILIVNGNTTQAITDRVVAVARRCAPANVEFVGFSAPFGADVVKSAPENLIAGHAVLQALAEHHEGFDAAILAISFDTALAEARALLPIPVYGITEAALMKAAALGGSIGVITLGATSLPLYQSVFARYPASASIADVGVVDVASVQAYVAAERLEELVLGEINRMAARHAVATIVICGAAVAGIAERLQPQTACKLVDGVPAAVEAAIRGFESDRSTRGPSKPGLTSPVRMSGVAESLSRLFNGGK